MRSILWSWACELSVFNVLRDLPRDFQSGSTADISTVVPEYAPLAFSPAFVGLECLFVLDERHFSWGKTGLQLFLFAMARILNILCLLAACPYLLSTAPLFHPPFTDAGVWFLRP